ncbi:MAG: aminotransferase class I/II-fold pyridoxal phosphate-dependent enzyme, partial [Acutalibacteraceae bacterium]
PDRPRESRQANGQPRTHSKIPNVDIRNIFTGNGVSEMIITSMQALINPGDEILIPSPNYPLWTSAVCLAEGKPVHYICDEKNDWYPDIKDMEKKITSRTKGIVIINPNNPTGAVYPREVLEDIAELARRHDLIIFSDEIYDRLLMDGKEHVSMGEVAPDILTVVFNGLSKSHLATGFRAGWMCFTGNTECAKDYIGAVKVLTSMRLCSNVAAQIMIPEALKDMGKPNPLYLPGGRMFEQRKTACEELSKIDGISARKPDAAFYIFPKIDLAKHRITDDEKFALDLLHEKHVLIVQGSGFHLNTPDHFRITYLPDCGTVKTAITRIGEFLDGYRQ